MDNVPGNHYDKYHSKNPIEKALVKGFFDAATSLLGLANRAIAPSRILEAGCGEGVFAAFVRGIFPDVPFDAFDLEESVVEKAIECHGYLDIHFHTGNIYETRLGSDSVPLVVCSEVLEHLEHPDKALEELKRICSAYLFLSVPDEPIWRVLNMCRLKYLRNFGNTPGHINHYSKRSFLRLIRGVGDLEIVAYKRAFPWQMALVRRA